MKLSNTTENKVVISTGEIKDIPYSWMNELIKDLKDWRKDAASSIELPAYCVFPDSTLLNILNALPRMLNELWLVKGLNSVLIDTYGEQICSVVNTFLAKKNIVDIMYGTSAFDVENDRVKGILGYLGLLEYFTPTITQ